ncbi:hypothetical protein OG607_31100 [Streptomyces sp. NBC_01537]|uniref:hypothetical protein n=1 Tax=Streptomyces sp. NBC_01537 TaxID=2903896 RepID=UPI003868096D
MSLLYPTSLAPLMFPKVHRRAGGARPCRTRADDSLVLLHEIGRSTDPTRQAYTDGALVLIDGFAARLAPHDPPSARLRSLSLLGMLAGTLQLSRALTDRQLADELLEQGIHNALALLDAEQHN